MVRQMRQQGMKSILVSGDALVTDEYWSITGKAGDGTLMTFSPDPRKNPKAATVVANSRKAVTSKKGIRSILTVPFRLGRKLLKRPKRLTRARSLKH